MRAVDQALEGAGLAVIVETHAVDDGLVLGQPEQARPGIALLRTRGQRPHLDEAEAHRQHLLGNLGVLVEASGEPDRGREIEPATRVLRLAGKSGGRRGGTIFSADIVIRCAVSASNAKANGRISE